MKKSIIIILIGFLSIIIEGMFGYLLGSFNSIAPNLTLIIVVYLGFYEANPLGALLAFILGLEVDLTSGILIGPWAGVFTLVFGILSGLSQRIFIDSPLSASVAIFVSSMIGNLLYLLTTHLSGTAYSRPILHIMLEAISTAIVAPILFKFLSKKLFKRIKNRSFRNSRGV